MRGETVLVTGAALAIMLALLTPSVLGAEDVISDEEFILEANAVRFPATITIEDGYPQELDYKFRCNVNGFIPDEYKWRFGDGAYRAGVQTNTVYHNYAQEGLYDVTCVGKAGNNKAIGSTQVDAKYLPTPTMTVLINGDAITLGRVIEVPKGDVVITWDTTNAHSVKMNLKGNTPLNYDDTTTIQVTNNNVVVIFTLTNAFDVPTTYSFSLKPEVEEDTEEEVTETQEQPPVLAEQRSTRSTGSRDAPYKWRGTTTQTEEPAEEKPVEEESEQVETNQVIIIPEQQSNEPEPENTEEETTVPAITGGVVGSQNNNEWTGALMFGALLLIILLLLLMIRRSRYGQSAFA